MKDITVEDVVSTLTTFDRGVADIERKYAMVLPMEIKLLLQEYESQFVLVNAGEHYKVLDRDEIKDAKLHLGVDCAVKGIVPLIDCKDNNFLIYNPDKNCYEMLNIVDEMPFNSYPSLVSFWKGL
jgi:hypothetical protein